MVAAPLARGAVDLPVILALSVLCVLALLVRSWSTDERLVISVPAALMAAVTVLGAVGLLTGLDPAATAAELARATGLLALFVVLQNRAYESPRARYRALLAMAFAGLLVAAIGLAHFAFGSKLLFGLYAYEHARPPLLSTLGNPNHAAGILNATALVCLGIAVTHVRWRWRIAWAFGFLVAAGASLLCASRGGMAALGAAVAFFPLVGWGANRAATGRSRAEREEGQRRLWLVGLATLAAAVLAIYLYGEVRPVEREMDALAATDLETDGKVQVARVALRAISDHPLLGIGAGAFWTAHPKWLAEPALSTFTHVENEALEAVVGLGLPLGLALVVAIFAAFVQLLRRARSSWAEAGAAAAALALLLQGLVDFSLHFAAGFGLMALLAVHPSRRFGPLRLRMPRRTALASGGAALLAVVGLGAWAWPGLDAETARLEASAADPSVSLETFETEVAEFRARHPEDYLPCLLLGGKALAEDEPNRALAALACATERNPTSGRVHALTGDVFSRLGRKSQALVEYRMAAARGFPTMDRVLARWPEGAAIRDAAPTEPGPAAQAAGILEREGRLEEAVAACEGAVEVSPLGLLGDPDSAARLNRREIGLLANLTGTLHRLYSRQERHEEARALGAKLREALPGTARGWVLEASSAGRLERHDEARELYLRGLEKLPGDAELVFALASFELGRKEPRAALRALDDLPLDATHWQRVHRHSLRANAFRAQGAQDRARDELRLALRLRPDDKWLHFSLADAYLSLDRLDEAEAELRAYPTEPAAKRLAARIEKRREELAAEQRKLRSLRFLGSDLDAARR